MLKGAIPARVEIFQAAERSEHLAGTVPTQPMARLADAVLELAAAASVDLQFSLGDDRQPRLRGQARVQASRRCQRCLEPVSGELEATFDLLLVASEAELARLPEEADALIAEEGLLELAGALEDELLLSLPIIPRHERLADCSVDTRFLGPQSGGPEPEIERTENPFEVLRTLRKDNE